MSFAGWKSLKPYDGDGIVLAFDFTQGRPGATFADFSRHLEVDATLLETHVVGLGREPGSAVKAERYLDTWMNGVSAHAESVVGIIGHCAGAAFAGAVAGRLLETFSVQPRLVFLNPTAVTPRVLRGGFVDAVRGLGEGLSESEVQRELRWVRDLASAEGADVGALDEVLLSRYSSSVDVVVDRLELEGDVAGELSSRFASYLDYLMAASVVPLVSSTTQSVVVYDTDYEVAPEFAERCVRIDVGDGHLLDSAGVANVCSALLGRADRPLSTSDRC